MGACALTAWFFMHKPFMKKPQNRKRVWGRIFKRLAVAIKNQPLALCGLGVAA